MEANDNPIGVDKSFEQFLERQFKAEGVEFGNLSEDMVRGLIVGYSTGFNYLFEMIQTVTGDEASELLIAWRKLSDSRQLEGMLASYMKMKNHLRTVKHEF